MKKNHHAKPHSHNMAQLAINFKIDAASGPGTSMYARFGRPSKIFWKFAAIEMVPETVKAEGPTDTNMAGRKGSGGSFCVISR